jgi:hypothetical protein
VRWPAPPEVERREERESPRPSRQESALSGRGQHHLDIEPPRRHLAAVQPVESGAREEDRVGDALLELPEPRVDVPRERVAAEVRAQPPELRDATGRARADVAFPGDLGERNLAGRDRVVP